MFKSDPNCRTLTVRDDICFIVLWNASVVRVETQMVLILYLDNFRTWRPDAGCVNLRRDDQNDAQVNLTPQIVALSPC